MIISEVFHINKNRILQKEKIKSFNEEFKNILDSYVVKKGDTLTKILEKQLQKENILLTKKEFSILLKKVAKENNITNPDLIYPGQKIFFHLKYSKAKEKLFPVNGIISSKYGVRLDPFTKQLRFHEGIDIAAPPGTPIRSVINGEVIFSGWIKGYGNIVIIKNGNTITKYAHNKVNLVKKGDYVKKGEIIAEVGSTGRSTGAHLHFEVLINNSNIDPMKFLLS